METNVNGNNYVQKEKYYDQPISNGDVSGREEVEREVKNDEVAEIRPNGERHRENINEDFISAEKNIFKKNNTDKTSYTKKYESFLRKNLENGVHTINKELYYLKQNSPYGLKQEVKFDFVEEPIDLTYTQKLPTRTSLENSTSGSKKQSDVAVYDEATSNTSIAIAKIMEVDQFISNNTLPKKRGRKRKHFEEERIKGNYAYENSQPEMDCFQGMDQKQAEVLKAAKSLFSKRTRTLFHWMYPNTPKAQLKAAVSMSWETLGVQEKEFYISQVLGRFGFPQNSLMVNPQLDGIKGSSGFSQFTLQTPTVRPNSLVSSLLAVGDSLKKSSQWIDDRQLNLKGCNQQRLSRKRKVGRSLVSKNRCFGRNDEENVMKQIQNENNVDEFQDDPELSREFEQFKWTLHMNDNKLKH